MQLREHPLMLLEECFFDMFRSGGAFTKRTVVKFFGDPFCTQDFNNLILYDAIMKISIVSAFGVAESD